MTASPKQSPPSKRRLNLFDLTRGYRLRYAAGIGALALGIGFSFLVPLVLKAALDRLPTQPVSELAPGAGVDLTEPGLVQRFTELLLGTGTGMSMLIWAGILILVLTSIGGAFQFLKGKLSAEASEGIVRQLRNRLYGHLERLPCRYHDKADTGDLVQRCSSDVDTLRLFLSGQIMEIGRAVLLVATALPLMLGLHLELTLISMALFPVILLFAIFFFRRTKRLFQLADEAEGKLTTVLQENLTGVRVVRAFARQEYEIGKFATRNEEFRRRLERHIHLLALYWGLSDFISMLQSGLVLITGAWFLSQGSITVGTLVAFLSFEALLLWPIRQLGRVLSETGKAMVSLDRILDILEEPEEAADDQPMHGDLTTLQGRIRFEGLKHGFREDEAAIDGIDLQIDPGETVALLGPPGAGKSTLIQLLLRLYDASEGRILLDGRDQRELDRDFLRSQISVVLQEPFLFSRSIAFNLRFARAGASESEIVESTRDANIHESITGFEHGYDTLLGEKGVNLSGGQRQRLALARALLKDSPILVLDDAMSAVDTKTESQILRALSARKGRKTTILIAHRLSTVMHADRILILEHGRVVQDGAHEDLIRQEGPYQRLWAIQNDLETSLAREVREATS